MSDVDDRRDLQIRIEELLRSERARAVLLLELAPRVSKGLFAGWIRAAREIQDPLYRFLILLPLAERASGWLQEQARSEATDAANEIEDPEQRAMAQVALSAVANPKAVSLSAISDAFGASRGISDPLLRSRLLERILSNWLRSRPAGVAVDVPETFEVFRTLSRELTRPALLFGVGTSGVPPLVAQFSAELLKQARGLLTPEQLREALATTRSIPDEHARATVLAGIASLLPTELRIEGLAAAREFLRGETRAQVLIGFVPELAGMHELQTSVSREALALTPLIRHWNAQAAGFRRLNLAVPEPIVADALSVELGLDRPGVLTRALASLTPRLNLTQLGLVVEVAGAVPESWGKLHLLKAAHERAGEFDLLRARQLKHMLETRLGESLWTPAAAYTRYEPSFAGPRPAGIVTSELDILREAALGPADREIVNLVRRDPEGVSEFLARSLSMDREATAGLGPIMPRDDLAETPDPQAWPTPPQHVVSTGVSEQRRPAEPLPAHDALQPDSTYFFWVEIGKPVAGAVDETPTSLPVDVLPAYALLEVVVLSNDPQLVLTRPSRAVVEFVAGGGVRIISRAVEPGALASTDPLLDQRLFFEFKTPTESGEYRLRCGIYYKGVLVQSREATLRVGTATLGEPALVTRVDYTVSRSLSPAYLKAYRPHRLSVMVNRAGDGAQNFHFVGDIDFSATARFDSHEVQDLLTLLRGGLRQASWGSEEPWNSKLGAYRYGKPAGFNQLLKDLHLLAQNGYRAYDAIVDRLGGGIAGADLLGERMRRPGLVQLALRESARMVIPLALLYDFPFDVQLPVEKCRLCEHFRRSVGDKTPLHEQDCFTGNCPTYDDDSVICPGGFWGFRHALGVPVSLVGEGESPPSVPAVLEPADVVELVVAVCTDAQLSCRVGHVQRLRTLLPPERFHYADTRKDTLEKMHSVEAQVLYFYCHGGVVKQTPYIQVGPLTDLGIERSTLRQKKIRWTEPRPRPLVFVNGCHTVDVKPEVAIEMVSGFVQTAGASAVIGTEITVFEQLAVEFGERFLRAFLLERATLGEAVRRSRLAILQNQLNPLGLVYVPFGIASLHLAEPSA